MKTKQQIAAAIDELRPVYNFAGGANQNDATERRIAVAVAQTLVWVLARADKHDDSPKDLAHINAAMLRGELA